MNLGWPRLSDCVLVACIGPIAGKPAPTGMVQAIRRCRTCGSWLAGDRAGRCNTHAPAIEEEL
ncbi:hypothetical protein E8E78_21975 [Pseudomonas sp. BN505]|nr:hypothetical protein [Pseudomonas sp. BN605]MDH4859237.1 hypothetical protein [Pseudomonas sp. BN505]NTY93619.1 hypothetical protein [Pseudomonas putida]NTZ01436.1 hypothetical protein [Pseudomonas putida]NTZ22196.1 hypothetical protein [Pseudomonas putida]